MEMQETNGRNSTQGDSYGSEESEGSMKGISDDDEVWWCCCCCVKAQLVHTFAGDWLSKLEFYTRSTNWSSAMNVLNVGMRTAMSLIWEQLQAVNSKNQNQCSWRRFVRKKL